MNKPTISYSDFDKLDLRVGTILEASPVEGSEKLVKCLVGLGEIGQKTILSGIQKYFKVEDLVGLQVLVIVNLELKKMMGLESQGMILMAVEKEPKSEKITLLVPQNKVVEGTEVK